MSLKEKMTTTTWANDMACYNRWQNENLFKLCDGIGEAQRRKSRFMFFDCIHNTLNHILTIDHAILGLVQTGVPQPIAFNVFPYDSFTELRKEREIFDQKLCDLPNQIDDGWLSHILIFDSSSLGRKRHVPRAFMMMQMFNHQTHHRSQITTELFRMGIDYGNTDMPYNPYVVY